VLIISEDPWTRAGLAALLREGSEIEVVGQVGSAADLSGHQPDVVLWDGAGEGDWHDLEVPVLVLLGDETQALRVLAAGAKGVLLRQAQTEALSTAILAVTRGLVVIEPELLGLLLPDEPPVELEALAEELTQRELEVLQLLSSGLSNKAIARRLQISEHTAKFHVAQILGKLGVESRTEAVVRAAQLGLILL